MEKSKSDLKSTATNDWQERHEAHELHEAHEQHEQMDRCVFLESLLKLGENVDSIIEKCIRAHKDLASTLSVVFDLILDEIHPEKIFLITQNEDLRSTFYGRNLNEEELSKSNPELMTSNENLQRQTGSLDWFAMPLDMAGENIGSFGLAFRSENSPDPKRVFQQMNLVAEELDNYFFSIQESRFKHLNFMEIQRCLKSRSLNEAIDAAIAILFDSVPMEYLVLLYLDEDLGGEMIVQYYVYQGFKKQFDSIEKPMPELDALIKAGNQIVVPGNKDLDNIFPTTLMTETILLDGLVNETLVGKIMIRPPEGIGFSIQSREMVQVFAESLRQRLVDFNREKNSLRQFFSAEVTRKLLRQPNYKVNYLSPRKADIGIIFADVSGFTKLSEQVLKDPIRIAEFIDHWSKGATNCFYPMGGTLDKLVGDCLVVLFGPPFYDRPAEEVALSTLRAACAIRAFTRDFLAAPQNRDVQSSPFYKDFGVAIGLNHCPADVGMIGPNQDLTAFSSGMNNTARLQGLAKSNEIFVSPSVKDLVSMAEPGKWKFEGTFSSVVKNVQEPLPYFKLALPISCG